MKTLTKATQENLSPRDGVELLKKGNERFISNLKINRNLLQQVNETSEGQHPFAVIISCMDSRTSAELIFDQGLGDIFSIRIAGNVINQDIIGSTEFGCKVVGAKVVLVLGHTSCGAVKGALDNVQLGNITHVTSKINSLLAPLKSKNPSATQSELCQLLTVENVRHGIETIKNNSPILSEMVERGELLIVGALYDVGSGKVEFLQEA